MEQKTDKKLLDIEPSSGWKWSSMETERKIFQFN